MKKTAILIIAALISCSGCKSERDRNNTGNKNLTYYEVSGSNEKTYVYWDNHDDKLDVRSVAKVDTQLFRQQMNEILPPENIFNLFGSGYHNFYLALKIINERDYHYFVCTDASFWRGVGEETENMLYKTGNGPSRPGTYTKYSQAQSNVNSNETTPVFYAARSDQKKMFTVKPGIKNGKEVTSYKLFEISVFIGKDKKILRPWKINEVDISKYREHLYEKGVNRFWYATGLTAVSVDGFESVRKAIIYPEEALKNGITGRVVVQLFADADGNFAGYQLLKGLGYGCDEAVINAIMKVKPATYPTGQRSTIIVPFDFGPPQSSPVDLAVLFFGINSAQNNYNNIQLGIVNKNKTDINIAQRYFIYVYIDKHLVFKSLCNSISKEDDLQQLYEFRFRPDKPGTYDYTVYLDPERVLNDSNRENNIVRGTVTIK